LSAVVLAVVQFFVGGVAAALLLDPSLRGRRLIGSAFLLGTGISALALLLLSLAGIRWTVLSATITFSLLAIALWAPALRRQMRSQRAGDARPVAASDRMFATIVDVLTFLLIAGHSVFTTLGPIGEWDFWAIWGLKARVFLEHGGIDWAFLEHPYNTFTHPDYPPLLSLNYVYVALQGGDWDDRWLGILTTLFAFAAILIVRDLFREELQRRSLAALATLAVTSFALSPWIGMAEAPLIAFGAAGLLTIRRGVLRDDRSSIALGAVFLGLGALTKNEGLALAVAAVAGAVLTPAARRYALRLWPAFAIPAPWLILRAFHSVPTDLATGSLGERAMRQLGDPIGFVRTLADHPPDQPLFWIAVALSLLFFARSLRREQFVVAAVLVQIAFYLGAYIVTPNDLRWHISTSWVRLLEQIAVPIAFVALTVTGEVIEEKS
jgi:hypothetical protein